MLLKLSKVALCCLVLVLSFISCNNEIEPKNDEFTAEFVEPAVLSISNLKVERNAAAALRHIDSIREIYIDRTLSDRFYIYYLYADSYQRIGKKEKTQLYIDSIISLLENNRADNFSYNNYVWTYYFKADRELEKRNIDKAHEYYYKALTFAQRNNDRCGIGYYYLRMGMIIYDTEQYADAANYFKRSYNEGKDCVDNFGYFNREQRLLGNIALCFERSQQYDSAIVYGNKALDYINKGYERFPDEQRLLGVAKGVAKGNLGGVYAAVGENKLAEQLLKESIAINSEIHHEPIDAQFTRVKLASLYLTTNRKREAYSLLKEIDRINDTLPNPTVNTSWNKVMWKYWEKEGNTQKAYKHLVAYKKSDDELRDNQFNFSMANIDNRVKNLGQQYKISELENKASLREIYLVAAILLAVLAVVIVVLVIQNLRKSTQHVRVLQEMNDRVNSQSEKLKKALEEIEKTTQEKDRILKAVSHDMRSPINSSLALIDLLKSESDNMTDEQREYMKLMEVSNNNALNLTKDLLEVATLSNLKLERSVTDITANLEERVKLLQFKAAEKKQTINLVVPKTHISANVNIEKILRVVSNLTNNAMKFSPQESEIEIKLFADTNNFTIRVQDKGIGIPDNIKDKVFDLFSEAKRYGTSGEQPFGLGLSISKQIVEAHYGEIWFDSEENKGTSFYVTIPIR